MCCLLVFFLSSWLVTVFSNTTLWSVLVKMFSLMPQRVALECLCCQKRSPPAFSLLRFVFCDNFQTVRVRPCGVYREGHRSVNSSCNSDPPTCCFPTPVPLLPSALGVSPRGRNFVKSIWAAKRGMSPLSQALSAAIGCDCLSQRLGGRIRI